MHRKRAWNKAKKYYESMGEKTCDAEQLAGFHYSATMFQAEKIVGGIRSYITNRDRAVLACVYVSGQAEARWEKNIAFDKDEVVGWAVGALKATMRRRVGSLPHDALATTLLKRMYSKAKFGFYPDVLQAFKLAGPQPNASVRKYSVSLWGCVGEHFDDPDEGEHKLLPLTVEDYWGYEQRSGVNLCVELCAQMDEFFERARKKYGISQDVEDQIFQTVVRCVLENYKDIAWVPAIDFKISAMKAAVSAVVDMFLGAYKLQAKAKGGIGPELMSDKDLIPDLIARSWGAYTRSAKIVDSKEERSRVKGMWEYAISDYFGSVLWSYLSEVSVPYGAKSLGSFPYWLTFEGARGLAEIFPGKIDLRKFGYDPFRRNGSSGEFDLLKVIDIYRAVAEGMLYRDGQPGNLLTFCDTSCNKYIERYVNVANGPDELSRRQEKRYAQMQEAIIGVILD